MEIVIHKHKTRLLIIALGAAVLILGGGLALLIYQRHGNSDGTSGTLVAQTPTFTTMLPAGKAIKNFGGWYRVSPPQSDPAFAYSDHIDGVSIIVTQQQIPATFSDDIKGHVTDLANSYDATTKLDAGGTTVYLGTSAKGPQSVIFTKQNLLVLIKSDCTIDDTAWISYIKSLK